MGAIVAVITLQRGDLRVCVARLRYWFEHTVHECCEFVAQCLGPLWSRGHESGVLVMV